MTYGWSLAHHHRVESVGGGSLYRDCTERLAVWQDGARGRLEVVFKTGTGRLVPDGVLHSGGVVRGEDYLNLHRPGVVRALLDEALDRGWRPADATHVRYDGWGMVSAVAAKLRDSPV
ncbi:hypothetical protein [Dactylosporangium sp. CA-152071]|uniref:hypothetical protein n=1 Tax=Dactylosporangium sp. CA-152071 TaxID=3239933 RepID=UPI003D92B296